MLLLSLQINCFDCLTFFLFSLSAEKKASFIHLLNRLCRVTPVNGLNCSLPWTCSKNERPSFWCRQEGLQSASSGSVWIASKVINWLPVFTIPLSQFEIDAAVSTWDHYSLTTFLCQLTFLTVKLIYLAIFYRSFFLFLYKSTRNSTLWHLTVAHRRLFSLKSVSVSDQTLIARVNTLLFFNLACK